MRKRDSSPLIGWLKKRYSLLFLRVNERTDQAFAIVDLPFPPPDPIEQPHGCRITLSTPRHAEDDFLRTTDFNQGTTLFDSNGWKKRLLEISRQ